MNSMAQQAVPKGSGQKELRCAHSATLSNWVVTQDWPIMVSGSGGLTGRGCATRPARRLRQHSSFVREGHKAARYHRRMGETPKIAAGSLRLTAAAAAAARRDLAP